LRYRKNALNLFIKEKVEKELPEKNRAPLRKGAVSEQGCPKQLPGKKKKGSSNLGKRGGILAGRGE